jgi:murein L,D-transpeptidase YcbB/YkuD
MSRKRVAAVAAGMLMTGGLALVPAGPAAAVPYCNSTAITWNGHNYVNLPTGGGTIDCYMGRGAHSSAVGALQYAMNRCYQQGLAVDNDFGPATQAALRRVQGRVGVKQDGGYGKITRHAMRWPNVEDSCDTAP